jgi:hypothetical protein
VPALCNSRVHDPIETIANDVSLLPPCSTGVQIAAITQIDHRAVGTSQIGPIVKRLRELYFSIARVERAEYKHWVSPVYQPVPAM